MQSPNRKQMAEVVIVRKTLRKDSFLQREKECLQILHHLQHPNIVKLLASYSHCQKHHFLFPLLPMDLEDFLQRKERFGEFKNDFLIYAALEGLSSALEKVHSLNLNTRDHDLELGRIGYHHDLKPGNVLVDSRTFYLADFGLARLKPEDKGSRTQWKSGLGDYVAPECMDEKMIHKEVGRPLDIWSFGCMISEVAAYIEGGPDGVNAFREQRFGYAIRPNMKDHYFFSGNDLRPQVVSWFKNVKARSESSVLHNLLEIVGQMFKIDPMKRPKAAKVHQLLLFLSVKALFDVVQQALTGHLLAAQDQGDIVPMIRFQNARFAVWGKVLHLTGSFPSSDSIEAISDKGDLFRHTLTSLLGKVQPHSKEDEAVSPSEVALPIRKPYHEELQELIETLWTSLPAGHQEKLKNSLVTDSFEDEALHDIVSNTWSSPYSDLAALASTKLEIQRLSEDKNQDSEGESLLLISDELRIEREFSAGLSVGWYNDQQVFVELVSPTTKWNDMSEFQREQHMRFTTKIFCLPSKPSGFRVLDCLGFVMPTTATSKQHGYAFVWAFPAPSPESTIQHKRIAPISLFNILKSHNKVVFPLGERFRLAYKLVSCVRELNIVKWLHKNISSSNIVFFQEEGNASKLSDILENPYLVNFRYSRLSEKASHIEQTEKPAASTSSTLQHYQHYQHPDYSSSKSFREIYDYYSIGIVLLELGSWITLDVYLGNNSQLQSKPSDFRDILVNKYVPRLSHIMGATYKDVTLACLKSDFGQDRTLGFVSMEGQTVLREFYDKVVGPLGELSRSRI